MTQKSKLPSAQLESIALTLHDIGAVRFGHFTLHSGRKSPIYIDLRLLVSFPDILRQVAAAYRPLLEPLSFDLIAATPLAGLPIATAICLEMDIPLIYPRPNAKSHGTGRLIEGVWSPGQSVVLVDDLVTTGDSLLQSIHQLEAAGLHVKEAVVLIDRQQGGRNNLAAQGYTLHTAMELARLLDTLVSKGRISAEKRVKVKKALFGFVT
jgi:uridine monophosphate synthetase